MSTTVADVAKELSKSYEVLTYGIQDNDIYFKYILDTETYQDLTTTLPIEYLKHFEAKELAVHLNSIRRNHALLYAELKKKKKVRPFTLQINEEKCYVAVLRTKDNAEIIKKHFNDRKTAIAEMEQLLERLNSE